MVSEVLFGQMFVADNEKHQWQAELVILAHFNQSSEANGNQCIKLGDYELIGVDLDHYQYLQVF